MSDAKWHHAVNAARRRPGPDRSWPPPDRCGKCENCLYVGSTRRIVLAAANPPFSHVRPGEVEMWNKALADHPCTAPPRRSNP